MRNIYLLILITVFSGGCAVVTHDEEINTLQSYSKAQDELALYIEEQDAKVDLLFKAVIDGTVAKYKDMNSVAATFGDPVYKKEIVEDGKKLRKQLYRHQVKKFNAEKVYLYFNDQQQLVRWEHVKP